MVFLFHLQNSLFFIFRTQEFFIGHEWLKLIWSIFLKFWNVEQCRRSSIFQNCHCWVFLNSFDVCGLAELCHIFLMTYMDFCGHLVIYIWWTTYELTKKNCEYLCFFFVSPPRTMFVRKTRTFSGTTYYVDLLRSYSVLCEMIWQVLILLQVILFLEVMAY